MSNSGNPAASGGSSKRLRIGELLVKEGYVLPEHVREALLVQRKEGGKTVDILMRLGHLSVHQFAKFVHHYKSIPSIQLSNYQVPGGVVELVDREFVVEHDIFPIDRMGKLLTVAMVFPLDSDTIEDLERRTGLRVKALLCSKDDIRNAIERYYPASEAEAGDDTPTEKQIETTVKLGSLVELVHNIDSLPTLPQTVRKVQEASNDPDNSIVDVTKIIAMDPPVAARVLQLANSAAYGFQHRIHSVDMAATLLGLDETSSVVLSCAVINMVENASNFDHEAFWRESELASLVARLLAKEVGIEKSQGIVTAALLHHIGRFALSQALPGRFSRIDPDLKGAELIAAEQQEIGISHAEAGYLLAAHWELPPLIVDAIRFHHAPELAERIRDEAHVVALAADIAENSGSFNGSGIVLSESGAALADVMGLNHDTVVRLVQASLDTAQHA